MELVRWGLLSTARINRRLIPAIHASTRGRLVAVASRETAKARHYAAEWEIPLAFGSYEALLDSDQVDAIYVSLPNHLHTEWSIRALRAGKHVLCEKPLALSALEVDLMISASQETGRVLAEALMYRHHPQTKLAGDWIHSGRLGEVQLIQAVFNFQIGEPHRIRLLKEYGGGCLWDVGIYPVSFAQFALGDVPQSVYGYQRTGKSGVDEIFSGLLLYRQERTAQVTSSFRSPFYTFAQVIGSLGRLVLNQPFVGMNSGQRLLFFPESGEPKEIPVPEFDLYQGEIEDMQAAILDGVPCYLSLEESRRNVVTIQALYESAKQGLPVQL